MNMKLLFLLVVGLGLSAARADQVRLPCKYIHTTTTYSTLTGITIDEAKRNTLKVVALDIRKVKTDGELLLVFTKKPLQAAGETASEGTVVGSVAYDEKATLLEALGGAKKKLSNAQIAKVDETAEVYSGTDFKATLTISKKSQLDLVLGPEGESQFVLNASQVGQLIDAIKRQ